MMSIGRASMNRMALTCRREPRQRRFRARPLQRHQGTVGKHRDLAGAGERGGEMRLVRLLAGGIHHHREMIVLMRHHDVVAHAAGIVGEQRVALASGRERKDVAGNERFERPRSILDAAGARAHRDLAHVRDVEQARRGAGVQMLGDDPAGILQRHLVAGERHHARAEAHMQGVERRSSQRDLAPAP